MQCSKCLLSDDILGVTLNHRNTCNFCDLHEKLDKMYPISDNALEDMIARIKRRGRGHRYDCIVGISGGTDSSYLLHLAKKWGLRTLAWHFDNTFNSETAEHNMKVMLEATGFPCVRVRIDRQKICDVNKAFLLAGVSEADIPNDIAMGKLTLDIAHQYDCKTTLNGHSFRAEGSVPIGWTWYDGAYLRDVYRKMMYEELTDFPVMTVWDQVKSSWRGITRECPLYHIDYQKASAKKFLTAMYGFISYEGRHTENKYTNFAGWSIYNRFNIDKRRIELSGLIRSGKITKREALIAMSQPCTVDPALVEEIRVALGMSEEEYIEMELLPRKMFYEFNTYQKTFRRWRFLIWIGVKFGWFQKTFYEKYTRKLKY